MLKFACDFETTVYDGQDDTLVWSAAIVQFHSREVEIYHSIEEFFEHVFSIKGELLLYFHNLKFDGEFILYYLKSNKKFREVNRNMRPSKMQNFEYSYSISAMGQWYKMIIRHKDRTIEIRDSYKMLPFSLSQVGKSFKTEHQKLDMKYLGFRYPGCSISPQEMDYIKNDVLVMVEALEIMEEAGHTQLTIGAACMKEFKQGYVKSDYDELFPDLTQIKIPSRLGSDNAWDYIQKAYKGGWAYLVKGKEQKIFENGLTADANSLYPSVMQSESGNFYPYGIPHWFEKEIPAEAFTKERYFFVRFTCRFKIKEGYLPFVQIKGNRFYRGNECLETSDFRIKDKYYSAIDYDNEHIEAIPELTMTCIDYKLFMEHYDIKNLTILDGCMFYSQKGFFDEYIHKYRDIKTHSTGAVRTQAKLFSNNLYGKFATNPDSSYKTGAISDGGGIHYTVHPEREKKPGYIPIGAAVTSYARNETIRKAQLNFYGADKRGFIYADTDSIHCDLDISELKGVPLHDVDYGFWKVESQWDKAWFVRQKTYAEHVISKNFKPVVPFWEMKCAGMPDKCKRLFLRSMCRIKFARGKRIKMFHVKHANSNQIAERNFLKKKRTIKDFKYGLVVPGKLIPKHIKGGVLLTPIEYSLRKGQRYV